LYHNGYFFSHRSLVGSVNKADTVHDPETSNELFENVHNLEPELSNQIAGIYYLFI